MAIKYQLTVGGKRMFAAPQEQTYERICADKEAQNMVTLQPVIESNLRLRLFEVAEFVAVPQDLSPS